MTSQQSRDSFDDWNEPMDAANRRAHFERNKDFSAFHDGAMTPEIKAAIDKARAKILKKLKEQP